MPLELIRGCHNLRPRHRGCVLTVGNFDGVHRGHQAVLDQLAGIAQKVSQPAVLVTFEPHPQEFFAPLRAPARLTRLREKIMALEGSPVARVLCLQFDWSLANLSPENFIEMLLVRGLGARYVVVGDDFRFGRNRQGNRALLESAGRRFGFKVASMNTCRVGDRRVSSTWVRDALTSGDLATAAQLLGRRYSMCGRVIHGDRRGRTIGFPTANIALRRRSLPLSGVYAVQVVGVTERPLPAVANVGIRPTVDGTRSLLEVHALDFNSDLYGRHVQVEYLARLRDEKRFDSIGALKRQIQRDVDEARRYFGLERVRGR